MGANRFLFIKKAKIRELLTGGEDKRFLMGTNRSRFIMKAKRRELLTGGQREEVLNGNQ